jgi:hypothetical protein
MVYKKDLDQQRKWSALTRSLGEQLGKRPKDLTAVLYLIGIQELGKGNQSFSKEEKQDLIHIAICKIMSFAGFYQLDGIDQDGWPHWKLVKALPSFDLLEQEQLFKTQIIEYFEKEVGMFV